jgi:hypothetical protein
VLTCKPIVPDARDNIPCRDNLCCDKVLLRAVDFHAIVALHKDYAEEEAADHLSHQNKQQPSA